MVYDFLESPFGPLLVAGTEEGLKHISFQSGKREQRPEPGWQKGSRLLDDAFEQLEAYFAGELKLFDLTLVPEGTEFQQRVWKRLLKIAYGKTVSYGEIAKKLGNPGASRAVGLANGRNPLPIVIPCHRVIGADGSLTGYGGGMSIKRALLALERENSLALFPASKTRTPLVRVMM